MLLLAQRMPDAALAWALRLGLVVSLAGMLVAIPMTWETPEQARAAERAGIEAPIQGAHSVGVEDDGPGLPVTGWSTTGGDLRVPHFFGLHRLQALPLFGYLLSLFAPHWLRTGHRVALMWTAGLSYLGLLGLLTWQALRGHPLISPDAPMLGAFFALLLTTGTAGLTGTRPGKGRTPVLGHHRGRSFHDYRVPGRRVDSGRWGRRTAR